MAGRHDRRVSGATDGAIAVTRFLASVTSAWEAEIALAGGAQIIDAKDPESGPLGVLSVETVRTIAHAVSGRVPLSATLGHDRDDLDEIARSCERLIECGVSFLKMGVADPARARARVNALGALAARFPLVLVMLADQLFDLTLIDLAASARTRGILLDTLIKRDATGRRTSLRSQLNAAQLHEFVQRAREKGLLVGLAGGLSLEDIAPLARLNPDVLGFRGALCTKGDRTQALDATLVKKMRDAVVGARLTRGDVAMT